MQYFFIAFVMTEFYYTGILTEMPEYSPQMNTVQADFGIQTMRTEANGAKEIQTAGAQTLCAAAIRFGEKQLHGVYRSDRITGHRPIAK